jgi:hypothetical protein
MSGQMTYWGCGAAKLILCPSYENGRTYHSYMDGVYLMPNDEVSHIPVPWRPTLT